jgi:hypothetical protein
LNGTAAPLVLGFLLATAYGAGFHFLIGGPAKHILIYILASWFGFLIGHIIGDILNFELLKLGPLHLLTASIGSWAALILSWWLFAQEES